MAIVQINIMKTKPLIFLLALTFLFLFSGSSMAGLFSPNDYNEYIFENMRNATNTQEAFSIGIGCKSKFPVNPSKGPSSLFGPKIFGDCVLKYSKGVKDEPASTYIMSACMNIFETTVQESFVNYATPIMNSFDFEKLKEWGFKTIEDLVVLLARPQTKTHLKIGYMGGSIELYGILKYHDSWEPRIIFLQFFRMSHDEPWKLFVNNEAIEDRFYIESLDPSIRNLPEEVIKYIKSKFEILDKWEMVTHPNFLIITDPEN